MCKVLLACLLVRQQVKKRTAMSEGQEVPNECMYVLSPVRSETQLADLDKDE